VQDWGGVAFRWSDGAASGNGTTVWPPFKDDTTYFAPGKAGFMINYRVEDLRSLLAALREEGCRVDEKVEESEFGAFGWVIAPEGNELELWQPPEGQ
jgi:predicted enzyme related to lactoylglutathione lyase